MSYPNQPDSTRRNNPSVQVNGEVSVLTGFYALSGLGQRDTRQMPWAMTGYVTLSSRSGWVIPAQLNWSSQRYRYSQPVNQLGVSPRFKNWLTLHGGYRNVIFSPLTLAGHTFLGVGIELNPGLLRVGAVYGKFNRAIDANYADPERVATFRRTGYCAKLGLGNARNYFDVILLNVSDDARSVPSDTLGRLAPAENMVLGVSGRIQAHKKLTIELDAAGSAYTRDARTDTLTTANPTDPRFEYLNQVNQYQKLFTARQSTAIYTAVQASFSYRGKWADLRLRYKRIEPGYKSMGAYFFQQDLESITIAPALKLFKKRLHLRTSAGWQRDNLTNQKKTRTDRLIGSVNLAFNTSGDFSLDLSASNYGITQRAGFRPLNDTARIAQNNRTLAGTVVKSWTGHRLMHSFTGSATYQELQDLNPFTTEQNENFNWNYTASYAVQHLTTGLDLNLGYSYTRTEFLAMSSRYYGPSLSVGQRLFGDKLNVLLSTNYLKSHETLDDLDQTGYVLQTTLNLDYRISAQHRLSVHITHMHNQSLYTFQEQQGTVQYSLSF